MKLLFINKIPTKLGLFTNYCNSNSTELVTIIALQEIGTLERKQGGPSESTSKKKGKQTSNIYIWKCNVFSGYLSAWINLVLQDICQLTKYFSLSIEIAFLINV